MYYHLFKIEGGEVKPLTSREATIKEVRQILQRDKGSNGDADGRKKLMAYRELGFVYWVADYRSPGNLNGYEGKALVDDAKRNFNLPDTWEPDKTVLDLIELYRYNVNGGIAAKTLMEIASTFRLMLETVKLIKEKIRIKLNTPDVTDAELKDLMSMQNELLKLTADIPKKNKEIETAKEMLKQMEEDDVEIARGGVKVLTSMK